VYKDERRNLLAPQWSHDGTQIIFSVGGFPAFFDGFHKLFLKTEDRVEGGARIALINSDGTGYRELTGGSDNNAFPSFAPDGKRFVFRSFQKDGYGLRIMNLETSAVTTLTSEYDNFR
jgi:Tol biopolymer transport system component